MIQNFNEFAISNEENIIGGRRRKKRGSRNGKGRRRRNLTGGMCTVEAIPEVIEMVEIVEIEEPMMTELVVEEISTQVAGIEGVVDTTIDKF